MPCFCGCKSCECSLDLFQYRFVWEKPSYTSGLEDGRIAFEDEGNKSYCRVSAVQIQGRMEPISQIQFNLNDRLK